MAVHNNQIANPHKPPKILAESRAGVTNSELCLISNGRNFQALTLNIMVKRQKVFKN